MTEATDSDGGQRGRRYERSGIPFPYEDLEGAIEVVNVVHNTYGGHAEAADVAGVLGQTPKSGAFRSKIGAARLFGFLEPKRGTMVVTDLGRRVLSDNTSHTARAEAFLTVPLFQAMFEEFKGGALPGEAGLEARMRSLGVPEKMVRHARQVFQRSAQQAGFFDRGDDRLVRPPTVFHDAPVPDAATEEPRTETAARRHGVGVDRHPLMIGLLQSLPAEGETFPAKARERWLNAVRVNFDFIYGPADESDPASSDGHA